MSPLKPLFSLCLLASLANSNELDISKHDAPYGWLAGVSSLSIEGREEYSILSGIAGNTSDYFKRLRFYGAYGAIPPQGKEWLTPPHIAAMQKDRLSTHDEIKKKYGVTSLDEARIKIDQNQKIIATELKYLEKSALLNPQDECISIRITELKGQLLVLDTEDQALDDRPEEYAQTAIAGFLQTLFPSPNFMVLAPNMRNRDPIGDLLRDSTMGSADFVLDALIRLRSDKIDVDQFKTEMTEFYVNFLNRCQEKYKGPDKVIMVQSGYSGKAKSEFTAEAKRVINLIVEAIAEEKQDSSQSFYPKNIVITAFLTFIWSSTNKPNDMLKLNSVIQNGPLLKSLELGDYTNFSQNPKLMVGTSTEFQTTRTGKQKTKAVTTGYGPDLLTFMLLSSQLYDRKIPPLPIYRGGVKPTEHPGAPRFYDCVEDSVMAFMLIVLNNQGVIDLNNILSLSEKFAEHAPFAKLLKFFNDIPSISASQLQDQHNLWANVVSALPGVKYVHQNKFEAEGGAYNLLDLIAALVPDDILNQKWSVSDNSVLAAQKMTRFCELFSRDGFNLSWQSDGQNSKLSNDAELDFSINGETMFTWEMSINHLEINSTEELPKKSWMRQLKANQLKSIPPMIESLRMRSKTDKEVSDKLTDVRGAVKYAVDVIENNKTYLYPILGRIITQTLSVSPEDGHAFDKLLDLLVKYKEADFFLNYFPSHVVTNEEMAVINTYIVDRMLYSDDSDLEITLFIQNHPIEPMESIDGKSILMHLIKERMRKSALVMLTKYPNSAKYLTPKKRYSPLKAAIKRGMRSLMQYFPSDIINTNFANGDSPLHVAILKSKKKTTQALIDLGADINAVNANGMTPLHLAYQNGDNDLVQILTEKGAIPDAFNMYGLKPEQMSNRQLVEEKLVDIRAKKRNKAINFKVQYVVANPNQIESGLAPETISLKLVQNKKRGAAFSATSIGENNLVSLELVGFKVSKVLATELAVDKLLPGLTKLSLVNCELSGQQKFSLLTIVKEHRPELVIDIR